MSNEGNFSFIADLSDTPNPQLILLPTETHEVTITILDVYKGARWEDTCINFVYGLQKELFENLRNEKK